MKLRPLPRVVIALSAGIIAALRLPPSVLLFALALGALIYPVLFSSRRRAGQLVIASAALGVVLAHRAATSTRSDCRFQLPDSGAIEVVGMVIVAPPTGGSGFIRLDRVRRGRGRGREEACGGEIRIRYRGRAAAKIGESAPVGTLVRAHGRWRANPPSSAWPSPPERAGTLTIDSLQVLAPPAPMRHPLLALRTSIQSRFRELLPERQSALAEAMLLARKEGIDPEQRDRFARAGLAHLLAISGLHVGLIAGTLLLLGGVFRLSPRVTALVTVPTTIAYVLFLGAPHAAARAALQVTLALAGRLWQRAADPFSMIATAALVLLVHDPLALLDPGFQLSFAGTGGIIALRRRFLDAMPRGPLPKALRESVAVSIAATLATAPFTVMHFGQIAPVGVVANLVAIPLTGVAVPALVLALVVSYVSLSAGRFLADGAELLLGALDAVARAAADLPGGQLLVPRDAVFGWALAALLAAVLAGRLARRAGEVRLVVRRVTIGGTIAAVLIIWPAAVQRLHDGRLEVHAIDVGQGDAFAIRTPRGRWIVVDAGPGGAGYDAGRARVVPFLLRNGARRIDALILSHPDADHIGGAGALLDAFDVGLVIDPGIAFGRPLYRELLHRAQSGRLRWIAARSDLDLEMDGVQIRILGPDEPELDEIRTTNQLSVAFRLDYGRFGALFLGDAPAAVEEELAARHGTALGVDLLKVAHHGSNTSTSEALLEAARPRIALISAGRDNRFGHPTPAVLERLERYQVQVFRTDLAGTITLRTGPEGMVELKTER